MPTPCPFLPSCGRPLSWRDLNELRTDQGPELYRLCLEYGQQLWLDDLPARALLAVDRALYCEVPASATVLTDYPWPYRAIGWMVKQPSEAFTGNARVHYQHLADRVRGERAELKQWRAWAAWAVVRQACPALPGDPLHLVSEPNVDTIAQNLHRYASQAEVTEWQVALTTDRPA